MLELRTLRRSRSLTYLDLAALTGIPARALAEAEHGLRTLARPERETLALVLGLPAAAARTRPLAAVRPATLAWASAAPPHLLAALALAATLATMPTLSGRNASLGRLFSVAAPASPLAAPALAPISAPADSERTQAGRSASEAAAHTNAPAARLVNMPALPAGPPAAPADVLAPPVLSGPPPRAVERAPAFVLTERGPQGCPVHPSSGRVVLTQGYGVGSHAPATTWGAVDLAVDSDGDGYAEPAASWYAPVVATHAGQVRVTLDSYPAGNHVWIADPGGLWRTGYAHLALVTVISGQQVRPGEIIGLMGSTGAASGPHLDYQVWRGDTNIDPTELVGCGGQPRKGGHTGPPPPHA